MRLAVSYQHALRLQEFGGVRQGAVENVARCSAVIKCALGLTCGGVWGPWGRGYAELCGTTAERRATLDEESLYRMLVGELLLGFKTDENFVAPKGARSEWRVVPRGFDAASLG